MAAARRDAARQDRPCDHHDPLRGRTLRLARRRDPSEPGQRHRRDRGRRAAVRRRERVGHVDDSRRVRSAGQRSLGDQDEADRIAGARRRRVPAAGRARAKAEESSEHPDRHRHGGGVVRVAWESRRHRVLQAGRLQGRRAAAGRSRHPRQRPHDDGREEQPRGAEADPGVDRQERECGARRAAQPEGRREKRRLHRDEARRHRLFLGRHRTQEDALRHDHHRDRCSCSTSRRRKCVIRFR